MKKVFLVICLLVSVKAISHGENLLGPNQGYIRMPGPYHVELVAISSGFEVFLHDVNNKNTTIENSKVSIFYENNLNKIEIPCTKNNISFKCIPAQKYPFKTGKILIDSTRLGNKGKTAEYTLPLSLQFENKIENHQGHVGH